jgi:hypothetical protein
MAKNVFLVLVGLLLTLATSVSMADPPTQPVKWSQLPDMNRGLDYSSETKVPSVVASDWRCQDGLPVTDIHWWGSYWVPNLPVPPDGFPNSDGFANAPPGGIQAFILKIYSDVPAGGSVPFSRPGQLLWAFDTSNYNEVLYGTTAAGKDVLQYNVYLPQADWFAQVAGQIYWLSIEAVLQDPMRQWGWHESKDHSFDDAVQDFKFSGWSELINNTYSVDMAFELTTPEPAALLLLALGGLALLRRR